MLLKGDLFPVTSAFETKRRITIGTIQGIFSFLQFGRNQKENMVNIVGKSYSFFCATLILVLNCSFLIHCAKEFCCLNAVFLWFWGEKNSCRFLFYWLFLGVFYDLGRTESSCCTSLITFTIQYPLTISVL